MAWTLPSARPGAVFPLRPLTAPALAAIAALVRGPAPAGALARHRTGWTARVELPDLGACCLKTYLYPGLETLKGAFRTTFLQPSRAAREARTLAWLRARGLAAPEPLAYGENRFLGWLLAAWILTRFEAAPDVERWLRRPAEAAGLAGALGRWLGQAHRLGLEDRNPHLRNFLARPAPGGWEILKVDSPRARICPGAISRSARARDLRVLRAESRRHGVPARDRRAFLAGYRQGLSGPAS